MSARRSSSPEPLLYDSVDSPLGELLVVGDGHALRGLFLQDGPRPMTVAARWRRSPEAFAEARTQLAEYFARARTVFTVRTSARGTPFQRRVWRALAEVGYGQTVTYGELARRIERPSASRAVGLSNGRNPISIVVPCHRVVGSDGALTGYGGGIERKRMLLALEAAGAGRRA
jgi:methylated-DNA-[protein]-cysteine S-methyltransferase